MKRRLTIDIDIKQFGIRNTKITEADQLSNNYVIWPLEFLIKWRSL